MEKSVNQLSTLVKLSDNQPKLIMGIRSILDGDVAFPALNRAIIFLSNAKNDFNLNAVEAGLQTTINDIRQMNQMHSPDMDNGKAALYLYTLQNLMFCLSDWHFENGNQNNYVPEIAKKYQTVLEQAAACGVDIDVIHNNCFTPEYQNQNDPDLRDFEFLDEARVQNVLVELKEYQRSKDPAILDDLVLTAEKQAAMAPQQGFISEVPTSAVNDNVTEVDRGVVQCQDGQIEILDKVINIIKTKYGQEKVNLAYIRDNLSEFFSMVGEIIRTEDREAIANTAQAIVRRVAAIEQSIQGTVEQNDTETMEMGR